MREQFDAQSPQRALVEPNAVVRVLASRTLQSGVERVQVEVDSLPNIRGPTAGWVNMVSKSGTVVSPRPRRSPVDNDNHTQDPAL